MTKLESGVKRRREREREKKRVEEAKSDVGESQKERESSIEMVMSCQAIRTSYETLDRAR